MKSIYCGLALCVLSFQAFAYEAECEVQYGHYPEIQKAKIKIIVNNRRLTTFTAHTPRGGGHSKFYKKTREGGFEYVDENGLVTYLGPFENGKFLYDYDGYAFGTCYFL
ncbi:hypothetical protein CLV44_12091 [Marinobacterium halophilum]|uniref:MORN repeat protein n=1 Tax=Marinobacterium halophilum TaxID=267374 RepID=A0A2P8ERK0_9GAMM|nr:hypothetical protein [Marinobacterium halophilum]PSL12107.1 hypothetical protein CLV44_12091 [Marinobacterium halophilum]